jgi:hypothetical protein
MSSNVAVKVLVRSHRCIRHSRRRPAAKTRAVSSANNFQQPDSTSDAVAATLVATAAAGVLYCVLNTREDSACETKNAFPFSPLTARAEPRKFKTQIIHEPKNVMLHRMRSAAGRGLNDKYKVDWKTVLGEGAYGSVHPARLACTREKVSSDMRWGVVFKLVKRLQFSNCFQFGMEYVLQMQNQ